MKLKTKTKGGEIKMENQATQVTPVAPVSAKKPLFAKGVKLNKAALVNPFKKAGKGGGLSNYGKVFGASVRMGEVSWNALAARIAKNTGRTRKLIGYDMNVLATPSHKSNGNKCKWVGTKEKGRFVAI
jgi:hypothetical protein